jgi:hypothetical protein
VQAKHTTSIYFALVMMGALLITFAYAKELPVFFQEDKAILQQETELVNSNFTTKSTTFRVFRNDSSTISMLLVVLGFISLWVVSGFAGMKNDTAEMADRLFELLFHGLTSQARQQCDDVDEMLHQLVRSGEWRRMDQLRGVSAEASSDIATPSKPLKSLSKSTTVMVAFFLILLCTFLIFASLGINKYKKFFGSHANDWMTDFGFHMESLFFSFLLLVPLALHEFRRQPYILMVAFVVSYLMNVLLEASGFFRWAYPHSPNEPLLCIARNSTSIPAPKPFPNELRGDVIVDIGTCIHSQNGRNFTRSTFFPLYGTTFGAIAVAAIFIPGPLRYLVNRVSKAGPEVTLHHSAEYETFADELFHAGAAAMMALIATEISNLRRTNSFMSTMVSIVVVVKFLLHHLVWRYTGVNDALNEVVDQLTFSGFTDRVAKVKQFCSHKFPKLDSPRCQQTREACADWGWDLSTPVCPMTTAKVESLFTVLEIANCVKPVSMWSKLFPKSKHSDA